MTYSATLGGLNLSAVDGFGCDWSVNEMDGWDGRTKPRVSLVPKPRQSGSWAGAAYADSRHVALSGLVSAPDQDTLVDAFDRLNDACSLDGSLLTIGEGSQARWVIARSEDEVIPTYITDTLATWSVQVFAEDWRKFGATLTGSTFLPVSTGGLVIPFTVPFSINSTVLSGQVSLTNPGNETGPVVHRIDGPAIGPVITHIGTGDALVFSSSLVLGVGEWLTVDMEKRTALANDQASRSGYITSRGWSGFDPGVNVWSFAAAAYDPATKLTVSAVAASK